MDANKCLKILLLGVKRIKVRGFITTGLNRESRKEAHFFFQTSRQSRKMSENVLTLTSLAVTQAKNVGGTVALVNPRTEIGALLKFQSKLHKSIPLIF